MNSSLSVSRSAGSLPSIVRNDDVLYAGDLEHYFRVVFHRAQNSRHPYHNFRHMCHVMYLCYRACEFYENELDPRTIRDLLIAALFHDFDHSGMMGNDDLNIIRALRGFDAHVLFEDRDHRQRIKSLIESTQYPYIVMSEDLELPGLILRDADVSQCFSYAWIQQVIFGLAAEWNMRPLDVLKKQEPFLRSLTFHTDWAKQAFPQQEIDAKIAESRELIVLLEAGV